MARERGSVRAERSLKGRTDGRAVEADPRPPAPHTDLLPPRVRSAGEGPEAERSGLRGVPIPGGEAGARRLLPGRRTAAGLHGRHPARPGPPRGATNGWKAPRRDQ